MIRTILGAFLLLTAMSLPVSAQQPEFIDREPEIKAAYLYNFGRYVEWPEQPDKKREFSIGVLGESALLPPLRAISKAKTLNNRAIKVQSFRTDKEFRRSDILFIPSGSDPKQVAAILKAVRGTPVLIVGEDPNFALQHGHLGFYADQNNVKFEINKSAAQKAGLKISSKLLSLGRLVGEKP